MSFILGLLLLSQVESGESKEDCRKAVDAFHAAMKGAPEAARLVAIDTLAKHHCVAAVGALAPLLQSPDEGTRVAVSKALGGMDLLEAVQALGGEISSWESSKNNTFDAMLKALQTLDWEAGAEPLHGLLTKYHEKGMIDEMKPIIQTLGNIGSSTSVAPLLQLLEHAENEANGGRLGKTRSAANPKLKALEGPIRAALQSITGGNEPTYRKWREWWQENRDRLIAGAMVVYHCHMTGKRWEQKSGEALSCPFHDKPDKDGQVVKTKLRAKA